MTIDGVRYIGTKIFNVQRNNVRKNIKKAYCKQGK